MKSNNMLNFFLLIIGFLGIMFIVLKNKKESFMSKSIYFSKNVNPGNYPVSVTKGILYGDYKQKKNKSGLSNYNSNSGLVLFPDVALGSYKQETNNKRYWETPCNGSSIPPSFCGGLYEKKIHTETFPAPPKSNCLRVNYYCSH